MLRLEAWRNKRETSDLRAAAGHVQVHAGVPGL